MAALHRVEGGGMPPAGVSTEWVDPGEVLIRCALLEFRPEGTKMSIIDHELHNDHPLPWGLQGIKRWWQGSSSEDLYNLSAPIFYSIQWLHPHDDETVGRVFRLALEGLQRMREHAYRNDPFTRQYLRNTHIKMLQEGIAGREITNEDFDIPIWAGNPLAEESQRIWTEDVEDGPLQRISKLFAIAIAKKAAGKDFTNEIGYIKRAVLEVNLEIRGLAATILSGGSLGKAAKVGGGDGGEAEDP